MHPASLTSVGQRPGGRSPRPRVSPATFGPGFGAAHVQPVLATQCYRAHRVLGRVIGEFHFRRVVETSAQLRPNVEGVGDRFARRALRRRPIYLRFCARDPSKPANNTAIGIRKRGVNLTHNAQTTDLPRLTVPDGSSANRKLSGFHGGISPVKSACRKRSPRLALILDGLRATRKLSFSGSSVSPGREFLRCDLLQDHASRVQ